MDTLDIKFPKKKYYGVKIFLILSIGYFLIKSISDTFLQLIIVSLLLIPLIIFINRSRYNDSKDYLSRFAKINNFQFSEIRALVLNLKIRSWQKYGVVMELEGVEVNMSYCYADNIIVIAIRTRYSLPKIALYTKEFISRRNKNKIFVNNEFDFKNC